MDKFSRDIITVLVLCGWTANASPIPQGLLPNLGLASIPALQAVPVAIPDAAANAALAVAPSANDASAPATDAVQQAAGSLPAVSTVTGLIPAVSSVAGGVPVLSSLTGSVPVLSSVAGSVPVVPSVVSTVASSAPADDNEPASDITNADENSPSNVQLSAPPVLAALTGQTHLQSNQTTNTTDTTTGYMNAVTVNGVPLTITVNSQTEQNNNETIAVDSATKKKARTKHMHRKNRQN